MGEEEKPKPAKHEPTGESKKEDKPAEEKKKDDQQPPPSPPSPPPEIILRVYMHCEGCARKVRRCLKGFDGVEDVITDCKASKVVVRGEKADPLKVLERIQKKSHRQVVLISPIPKPPVEEDKKTAVPEEKPPAPEEKKEELPVITVVLKVHMHCEACSMEIKKRILRMKGIESVEPDIKTSEVAVKGAFDPAILVDYLYKRTGKQAVIVKQEPEKKKEEQPKEEKKEAKEEKETKKDEGGEKKKKAEDGVESEPKDKKGEKGDKGEKGEEGGKKAEPAVEEADTTLVDVKKNEHYYPPVEMMYFAYPPPQIFSDENPNACTVM